MSEPLEELEEFQVVDLELEEGQLLLGHHLVQRELVLAGPREEGGEAGEHLQPQSPRAPG